MKQTDYAVTNMDVAAYTIPTDAPEADGTIAWTATTIVVVEVMAAGMSGMGYTYADTATAHLAKSLLAKVVVGQNALDINVVWRAMHASIRNLGQRGVATMAISAVDNALWDLKAKLLYCSLLDVLGATRQEIDIYGSGGFTCYSDSQLTDQLGGWARDGFRYVKMKVGTHPDDDPRRVRIAREAVGPTTQLFVDANGAYATKQALELAEQFAEFGVTWFEEPRPSDDLEGLRLLRDRAPAGMEIAAGEYGFEPGYFKTMLEARSVDVLQADATRCTGITGFLSAAALCDAWHVPLSAHCAPHLHATLCCAVKPARHLEYFHDHARIESMLFDGAVVPAQGKLRPDRSRPGLGLDLKRSDAEKYMAA